MPSDLESHRNGPGRTDKPVDAGVPNRTGGMANSCRAGVGVESRVSRSASEQKMQNAAMVGSEGRSSAGNEGVVVEAGRERKFRVWRGTGANDDISQFQGSSFLGRRAATGWKFSRTRAAHTRFFAGNTDHPDHTRTGPVRWAAAPGRAHHWQWGPGQAKQGDAEGGAQVMVDE